MCTAYLVTPLDLVTVFWKTKSVTKSRVHCISYESWGILLKLDTLLRLLRLKLGLGRSPKWPKSRRKKTGPKMLKSSILKLQKHNTPQKKAENNCHSDLKENYRILLWKSWKKIDFVIFDPKKSWPRLGLGWMSEKRTKIVKKLLD